MLTEARQLFVFSSGSEQTLLTLFDPWDPACGTMIEIPYYFFAVDHPEGWVLVDCGVHPAFATDPVGRLGEQAAMSSLIVAPEDDMVHRLATIGVRPEEVAHVIVTHLHYDHCGGLTYLPNATVHVQEAERRFAEHPPLYQAPAYIADDWAGELAWHQVVGEHDLFDDGSIVMFPTPGHTPGHQSVTVRLHDEMVILVGDAAYHPEKMAERRLPAYLWNPDAMIASWEELERRRDESSAVFLFSHYPPPDQVVLAPHAWRP
jgi:glyoxylase-like metal-dependent hydrolase (beta-lactamase superfamily II)